MLGGQRKGGQRAGGGVRSIVCSTARRGVVSMLALASFCFLIGASPNAAGASAGSASGQSAAAAAKQEGSEPRAEPTGLPSYFDACTVFSPDLIGAAIGKTLTLRDTLGPEGFEAAACSYLGPFSASGQLSVDVRAFTRASVEGSGSDFSVDGAFVGDFPIDPASAVDVALGDHAQFGHESGTDQISELTVRAGDIRLIVGVASDPGAEQATATAAAEAMLQILTSTPPAADPVLADGSLSPAASSYVFGDGREFDVHASVGSNRNAVLAELDGAVTSGRNVYFNGDEPSELDLRRYALSTHGADRIAVLEFAGPLGLRTTWDKVPISQRIEVIFTPPGSGTAIAVAIEPDGSGAVVTDPGGAATISAAAPVLITGNWAALVIPGSLGIGADWSVKATVRMESATPLSPGTARTGWALETVPVTVGALTGEAGSSVPVDNASILKGFAPGSTSAAGGLVTTGPLPTPTITSVAFDARDGQRKLAVTFDRPLKILPAGVSPASVDLVVNVELAPPGGLSSAPPLTIAWNLMTDATGADRVSATASVRDASGLLATVPLTAAGPVVTIDLAQSTPTTTPPPAPTTTTSPDTTVAIRIPTLKLGGRTQKFRLNIVLSADQCLCPTGAPAGYDASGLMRDSLSVIISGDAIALTRKSTGSTAVGALDPATGHFEASNATEFWSGTLDNGLNGEYAVVGPTSAAPASRTPASVFSTRMQSPATTAGTGAGGWSSLLDPLNQAANAASGGGAPGAPGPAVVASPCGPTETYQVYAGGGEYITTTQPPPFFLPDQSFNQNNYMSNYDFGSAVSGRWPPPGCGGGQGIRATTGATTALPVARHGRTRIATSEQTESAPLTLADVAENWTLRATTFIEQSASGAFVDQSQFSATTRLDLLTTFTPIAVPSSPTTVPTGSTTVTTNSTATSNGTASTPSAAEPTTTSPSGPSTASTSTAPSSSGSGSGSTVVAIVVIVVAAGTAIAIGLSRRRRKH